MKVLVTAGPTREALDPVRYISNPSTGKMGYALAEAAIERRHQVALISGPTSLDAPAAAKTVSVENAQEMLEAVLDNVGWCDVLIMAAAVCDWRPAARSETKLKKRDMTDALQLESTPDILKTVQSSKEHRIYVGFAAETGDPVDEALRKLEDKGLDMIVANDVSRPDSGFEADTNLAALVSSPDSITRLPLLKKTELADRILDWVENAVGSRI